MWIAIVIWVVITIAGFFGIQKTGNYENIWGKMFWYGLFVTAGLVAVKIVLVVCHLVVTSS